MEKLIRYVFLILVVCVSLFSVAENSCEQGFTNAPDKGVLEEKAKAENADKKQAVEPQKQEPSVLDSKENIRLFFSNLENINQYKGQKMYVIFAEKYFQSYMISAYNNVKEALSEKQFLSLGWKKFFSTVDKYREIEKAIFIEHSNPPPEVKEDLNVEFVSNRILRPSSIGMHNLAILSDKYFSGDMGLAYENLLAIVTMPELKQTHWTLFDDTTEKFKSIYGSNK